MNMRFHLLESDAVAVKNLVTETGFFSADEVDVAVELVEETLLKGNSSGYEFVFSEAPDQPGKLQSYTCYGQIPATDSSFDLYWIAVSTDCQGKGLGREVLSVTEQLVREAGGTQLYAETSGREQYTPTRAFYESMGYEKAAVLNDFFALGDDKVIYVKRLQEIKTSVR